MRLDSIRVAQSNASNCLLRLKIIAVNDKRGGVAHSKDAGIERMLGILAVDFLFGALEIRQRPPVLIEVIGVDRRQSAAFLGKSFDTGSLELKLARGEHPGATILGSRRSNVELYRNWRVLDRSNTILRNSMPRWTPVQRPASTTLRLAPSFTFPADCVKPATATTRKQKDIELCAIYISRHRLNEHNKHEPKGKRALILRKSEIAPARFFLLTKGVTKIQRRVKRENICMNDIGDGIELWRLPDAAATRRIQTAKAAEAQRAIQEGMQKEKSMMEGMQKGVEGIEKKAADPKEETKK